MYMESSRIDHGLRNTNQHSQFPPMHGAFRHTSQRPPSPSLFGRRTITVIRNDCGEKMMCEAARKACIALDCSDDDDPNKKQDLATSLKASFDHDYEGTWNAVVGSDFGASITHELSKILFFAIEVEPYSSEKSIYVLLFQQTDRDIETGILSQSKSPHSTPVNRSEGHPSEKSSEFGQGPLGFQSMPKDGGQTDGEQTMPGTIQNLDLMESQLMQEADDVAQVDAWHAQEGTLNQPSLNDIHVSDGNDLSTDFLKF